MALIGERAAPYLVAVAARPFTAVALMGDWGVSVEQAVAAGVVLDLVVAAVAGAVLLPTLFPVMGSASPREPAGVVWSHDGFDVVLPPEPVGDGDAPGPALICAIAAALGTVLVLGALLPDPSSVVLGMIAAVPVAVGQFVGSWIANAVALWARRWPVPVSWRAGTLTAGGVSWRWTGHERVTVDLPHLTLRIDRPDGPVTVSARRDALAWLAAELGKATGDGGAAPVPGELTRIRGTDVDGM